MLIWFFKFIIRKIIFRCDCGKINTDKTTFTSKCLPDISPTRTHICAIPEVQFDIQLLLDIVLFQLKYRLYQKEKWFHFLLLYLLFTKKLYKKINNAIFIFCTNNYFVIIVITDKYRLYWNINYCFINFCLLFILYMTTWHDLSWQKVTFKISYQPASTLINYKTLFELNNTITSFPFLNSSRRQYSISSKINS